MSDDYLWNPDNAAPDPFAAELERRLAPLGEELEELLDALDFDELDEAQEPEAQEPEAREAEAHEAVVSFAAPVASRVREPRRSWPWLAAAAAVLLSASVVQLVHEQRRRIGARAVVEVGGDGEIDGRVRLGVRATPGAIPEEGERSAAHAALVALRSTHSDLARCALGLEPGASAELSVALRLDGEGAQVEFPEPEGDRQLHSCLRAAFVAWEGAALGRAELRVDIELHNNQQTQKPQDTKE